MTATPTRTSPRRASVQPPFEEISNLPAAQPVMLPLKPTEAAEATAATEAELPPPPPPAPAPAEEEAPETPQQEQEQEQVHEKPAAVAAATGFQATLSKLKGYANSAWESEITLPLVTTWTFYSLTFVSLSSVVSTHLWAGMLAIFYHAIRTMFGAPTAKRAEISEFDLEPLVPHVVRALNTARSTYEAVIEAHNPRWALGAALSFWATAQLTAYVVSLPTLLFAAVNAACFFQQLAKHEEAWATLTAAVVGARDAALETGPAKKVVAALAHWELVPLVGAFLLSVWAYFLGLSHKALTLAFGVLVLNASGSLAQPQVQQGVKQIKKQARRMTMGANELFLKATTPRAKKGSKAL